MITSCIASRWTCAQISIRSIATALVFFFSLMLSGYASAQFLTKVNGDNQDGLPGARLPTAMVVRLTNPDLEHRNTINWKITAGSATFVESGKRTYSHDINSQGSTSVSNSATRLLLGSTPGPVTVTATAVESDFGCGSSVCNDTVINTVTFTATVDTPPVLVKVSGDVQSGAAGSNLALPLTVRASFAGSGLDSVHLTWQIGGTSATFTANGTQTLVQPPEPLNTDDPVSITLGSTPGPVQIHVICQECGNFVDFTATVTETGQVVKIVNQSGDHQSGATGSAGDSPLVVQVLDANSQPVAGQTVSWQSLDGRATPDASSSVSDAQGHAQVLFHYGTQSGAADIRATIGTLSTDFTLTALIPGLSIVSGDGQNAAPGATLPIPLTVKISSSTTTHHTNGLQDTTIVWTVVSGGGYVTNATTHTDASGNSSNQFTLGPNAGSNHVQASVLGGGSVTFSETAGLVGAKLTAVSGSGQTLPTYSPSQPLVVKLTDAQDKPIGGVTVQWTTANGVLTNASSVTDANGTASTVVTLHSSGSSSVSAQTVGVTTTPVSFSVNAGIANIPGLTPAQHAVAVAIDSACSALSSRSSGLTAGQTDLLARCTELTKNAGSNQPPVVHALDALTDDKATPQISTAQSLQLVQMDNLDERLTQLRHGAHGANLQGLSFANGTTSLPLSRLGDWFDKPADADHEAGASFSRWGFFFTGNYTHGSGDARAVRPGFDYDNAGLTAGVDYRFSDTFVAGIALGYGRNSSDIDADLGSFDSDTYNLSAYATWYRDDFYFNAAASLGWADYSLSRSIVYQIANDAGLTSVHQEAKAKPGGDQRSLVLAFGKDFHHDAWNFNPELRANYTRVSIDGYDESLRAAAGSGLGLHVADRSQNNLLGVLGMRASYTMNQDWGILIPNAQIEYNHEFNKSSNNVVSWFINDPTATPIVLADPRSDSNFFTLSFGLNAVWPQGRSGFILLEHVTAQQGVTEDRISVGGHVEF
jgi:uncharacterized protein with beta-barrel porin domain